MSVIEEDDIDDCDFEANAVGVLAAMSLFSPQSASSEPSLEFRQRTKGPKLAKFKKARKLKGRAFRGKLNGISFKSGQNEEFTVDLVKGHKNESGVLKVRIAWAGFSAKEDTWEDALVNLTCIAVRDYFKSTKQRMDVLMDSVAIAANS